MKVIIVGSGVVGEATGVGLTRWGYDVRFYDINPQRLNGLSEQGYQTIARLEPADIYMISVPTPDASMTQVRSATEAVGKVLPKGSVYVLRSTVIPGTTRSMIPLLERVSGLTVHEDFDVCHQPEYLRAAHSLDDFLNPRLVLIGETGGHSGDGLVRLYRQHVHCPVRIVQAEVAETAKLLHNAFNAARISFANETYKIGARFGLDGNLINRVVSITAEAANNPEYGIIGGRPYSGSCLPKDIGLLIDYTTELGLATPLIEAIRKVNRDFEGQ